jgi:DNA-binding beta-propeller fold protein YncE
VCTFNGSRSPERATAPGTIAGNIDLGGRPEFAVADGKGHVYVNLEDSSAVVAVDSKTLKVLSRWSLAPGTAPSGLAIDRAHRRLFSACGDSKTMVITDPDKGTIIASVPIGQGTDGAEFDPATQCAYSSNGEGNITVVHEDSPDKYTVVGSIDTQRGARTMAVDEKTHNLYTVTAQFNDPPAATPENPRPRRTMVPGTFVILKVGK